MGSEQGRNPISRILTLLKPYTGKGCYRNQTSLVEYAVDYRNGACGFYKTFVSAEFTQYDSEESKALFQDLLTIAACFSCKPEAEEILGGRSLPALPKRTPDRKSRVWLHGRSADEEVHPLATPLQELVDRAGGAHSF